MLRRRVFRQLFGPGVSNGGVYLAGVSGGDTLPFHCSARDNPPAAVEEIPGCASRPDAAAGARRRLCPPGHHARTPSDPQDTRRARMPVPLCCSQSSGEAYSFLPCWPFPKRAAPSHSRTERGPKPVFRDSVRQSSALDRPACVLHADRRNPAFRPQNGRVLAGQMIHGSLGGGKNVGVFSRFSLKGVIVRRGNAVVTTSNFVAPASDGHTSWVPGRYALQMQTKFASSEHLG